MESSNSPWRRVFSWIMILSVFCIFHYIFLVANDVHELARGWSQPCECSNSSHRHLSATETPSPTDGSNPKRRQIFIDGGANRGDTFFLMLNNGSFFPPSVMRRDIEVYLFEASPVWSRDLYRYYTQYPQIKGLYTETALWNNSNETLSFFVNGNHEASSAFFKDSRHNHKITVQCIELCEWMMHDMGFSHDDYIVLKLDVEGAEYTIFDKILQHKECMTMFDVIYIEWHPWIMKAKPVDLVDKVLGPGHEIGSDAWRDLGRVWTEEFRDAGVKMEKWD